MKRKSISISQFEKNQINQATFRRNKIYLDFDKIQNDQKFIQIKRRKPYLIDGSEKSQLACSKIGNTFRSSVQQLTNKLEQQTRKFKDRVSPTHCDKFQFDLETGYQTSRTSFNNPEIDQTVDSNQQSSNHRKSSYISFKQSPTKVKGLSLDKQLTRQYLHRYKIEKNHVVDERNFNNFYIKKHDLSKTQDFKKLSPRNINFVQEHINDLNYNTQKAFQKFYFSAKPMKSIFKYNLQNSKQGRKFYNPVDPNGVAATALDPQKIHKSFTEASNFHPNKIDSFYKITGRDLPHQIDQRMLSPIKNYYKDSEGRLIKQKIDYSVKKMYDDLIRNQKDQQNKKKNPQFTRNQICDQKYFKQMIKRQHKMLKLQRAKQRAH